MTRPETLTRLRELHGELVAVNEELESDGDVDKQTIEALGQLVTDVNILCDKYEDPDQHDSTSPEHLALTDRIKRFESSHPRIVRFLSQMTDILAMIGI
jgi:Domain of unknown function (DUF4404)